MKQGLCEEKSIKFSLEKGKRYMLCNCGESGKLPLCDGSHRRDPECDIKPNAYQVNRESTRFLDFTSSQKLSTN